MKKLLVLLLIITSILFLSSCTSSPEKFDPDFEVAVMCSSNTAKNTDIAYLDKNLNTVHQVFNLKYSGFAMPDTPAVVKNGIMYGAPSGDMYNYDTHIAVETNLKNGDIKEYENDVKLAGAEQIAVNDKAYYVCANLNGVSTVGRYGLKTGKEILKSYNENKYMCIMNIAATDKYVFCGGNAGNGKKQYIYELDAKTLKMCKKIKVPYSASCFSLYGDKLYVPLLADNEKSKVSYICEYDIKNNHTKLIPMNLKNDTHAIMKQGNKLYSADSADKDGTAKNSRFIVYDIVTHKFSYIKFIDSISQAVMKNGFLYVLGEGKYESGILYKCKTNGNKIKILKQLKVTKDILDGDDAQSIFVQ